MMIAVMNVWEWGLAVVLIGVAGIATVFWYFDLWVHFLPYEADDGSHDLSAVDEGVSDHDLAAFHRASEITIELQYGTADVFSAVFRVAGVDAPIGAVTLFRALGISPAQLVPVFGIVKDSSQPIAEWRQLGTLEMICSSGPRYGLRNDDAFFALGAVLGKTVRVDVGMRVPAIVIAPRGAMDQGIDLTASASSSCS